MAGFARYVQQALVPGAGGAAGQEKLRAARVLVVGAGGLGTPVLTYLAAAGVGTLGIADGDAVAETNLHRQFLYSAEDIGEPKADILAGRLRGQNPDVRCETFPHLTDANAFATVAAFDIVCDCTDNAAARLLLDDACKKAAKPLVHAAVREWKGYLTVLHGPGGWGLCDFFDPDAYSAETAGCTASGVIGPVCGVAGSLMAAEVLKILWGAQDVLDGVLLGFHVGRQTYRRVKLLGTGGLYQSDT